MTVHERATIIPLPDRAPHLPKTGLVMPGAVIAGAVSLGDRVGIWPGASLRGEDERITIGDDSNVQDNCSLHVDHGSPLRIGARVSIGHNAVVHGCTVEDDVLIGMHATVMNGAVIGTGSIIAAGALVTEGTVIPQHSLVAGVPGRVRRETTEDERRGIARNAETYSKRIRLYVDAMGHR
jgi:carbonic anhydrase/acetyltransferase-like protein (isoleucine patch superfamily)